MSGRARELPSGSVDILLLKALSWGPQHGFGVSRWLAARSDGALGLDDAALYQGLHRIERRGWATADWAPSENNRRAKYYRLTPEGRKQLRVETAAWRAWVEALGKVLDARTAEG
jgi:PadR family transcriptional regulator